MSTKRNSGLPASLCALALLLVLAAPACSPVQRHDVLDFVFDGVPPYMTPEERARAAELAAVHEEERAAEAKIRARDQRKKVAKVARFTHGPFAAEECIRCHDLRGASGFRGSGGGSTSASAGTDLAEAGRLQMPVTELCLRCHSDYSVDAPANADFWIHGPVAAGWCVLCHQPHSSEYPNLLVYEPPARLCTQCHDRSELLDTEEHLPATPEDGYPTPEQIASFRKRAARAEQEEDDEPARITVVVRDCTRCHNPHRGPDRMILRPRSEWEVEAKVDEPEPLEEKIQPVPEARPGGAT